MRNRRRPGYYGAGGAVRSKSIGSTLIKQLLISIIIVLFIILVKQMDIAILNSQVENLEATLSKEITGAEVKAMAASSIQRIKNTPEAAVSAFKEGSAKTAYGAPIDSVLDEKAEEFMVYSVGGGTVSKVSESEKLGKFIEVTHDDGVVSVYGMLHTVQVTELSKVKKGQIIGTLENKKDNSLYFAMLVDGKVTDPKNYIDF